jgi:hypothetical protein
MEKASKLLKKSLINIKPFKIVLKEFGIFVFKKEVVQSFFLTL